MASQLKHRLKAIETASKDGKPIPRWEASEALYAAMDDSNLMAALLERLDMGNETALDRAILELVPPCDGTPRDVLAVLLEKAIEAESAKGAAR